jgi:hypothetical protein
MLPMTEAITATQNLVQNSLVCLIHECQPNGRDCAASGRHLPCPMVAEVASDIISNLYDIAPPSAIFRVGRRDAETR